MKFSKTIYIVALLLALACKPQEKPTVNSWFIENNQGYSDIFIPLGDNSFWLGFFKNTPKISIVFYHYDQKFNLIDSVRYSDYKFGNFIIKDDKIIVPAFKFLNASQNYGEITIVTLDLNLKIKSEKIITDYFVTGATEPIDMYTFTLNELSNGDYVYGLSTNYSINDTTRIILAAFDKFLNLPPIWTSDKKYWDFNQQILNVGLADIKSDADSFYLLGESRGSSRSASEWFIRKYNNKGNMLWQKIFEKQRLKKFGDSNPKIRISTDKIIVYNTFSGTFRIDKSGNKTEMFEFVTHNLYPLRNDKGFISLIWPKANTEDIKDATIFDNNLNIKKQISIGGFVSFGIGVLGKLSDGKYVAMVQVRPGLVENKMVFVKLDEDLNIIE